METKTLVIIGGAHAGPAAAVRARKFDNNARIILLEKEPNISFLEGSLRQVLGGDIGQIKNQMKLLATEFKERLNIEIMTNCLVKSIDVDANVIVFDSHGKEERISYDSLIYALGTSNKKFSLLPDDHDRVCYFKSLSDMEKIRNHFQKAHKKALVLGLGLRGLEAAISLKNLGFDVTVVEKKSQVFPDFSILIAKKILSELFDAGINVLLTTDIVSINQNDDESLKVGLLQGKSERHIDFDILVVTIGLTPTSAILEEAGAAIENNGLVRVNEYLETSLPNIYAVGSLVGVTNILSKKKVWQPLPSFIEQTAIVAGINALKNNEEEKLKIGSFLSTIATDVFGKIFARTGLLKPEASAIFGDSEVSVITYIDTKNVIKGKPCEIIIRLVFLNSSKVLIGAEVVGGKNIRRVIDVLVSAITSKLTLKEILSLDMAAIEDFGPLFSPLKEAMLKAISSIEEQAQVIGPDILALWIKQKKSFNVLRVEDDHFLSLANANDPLKKIKLNDFFKNPQQLSVTQDPILLLSSNGNSSFYAHLVLKKLGNLKTYCLDGGQISWDMVIES